MNSQKTRRRLSPSEKYEVFVSVLSEQATQREAAAAKYGMDRSTVVRVCQTRLDALAASVPRRNQGHEGATFRPEGGAPTSSGPRYAGRGH